MSIEIKAFIPFHAELKNKLDLHSGNNPPDLSAYFTILTEKILDGTFITSLASSSHTDDDIDNLRIPPFSNADMKEYISILQFVATNYPNRPNVNVQTKTAHVDAVSRILVENGCWRLEGSEMYRRAVATGLVDFDAFEDLDDVSTVAVDGLYILKRICQKPWI